MTSRFAPAVFTTTFCCAYLGAFAANKPLFLYYPLHGDLTWGSHAAAGIGPAMAWYGIMADAFIVAVLLAICLRDRYVAGALRGYLWVCPCVVMVSCVFLLRKFFA